MLMPMRMDEATIQQQVKWLNDPEIVRYSEQRHKKHNIETQRSYLGRYQHRHRKFREIHHGGEMIGSITAYMDKNNSIANLGILIGDKSKWGKGFGTEAWKGFCNHLLAHGTRKIEAGVMRKNMGMNMVCVNSGMVLEGRRMDHFEFEGLCDLLQYGMFA
jgi:ribosomal-protein-alanine N-acetyltransferase